MSGFKLIAIRPLKGCSKRFTKILNENEIYKFYNDYHFIFDEKDKNKVVGVNYKPTSPQGLYNIKTADGKELNINISAVVGKNGSGKSSLMELFYLAIYILSIEKNILHESAEILDAAIHEIEKNPNPILGDLNESRKDELTKKKKEVRKLYKEFKLELFYAIGENIYGLHFNQGSSGNQAKIKIIHTEANKENNFTFNEFKDFSSLSFFYSVVMNYSIYGLNSKHMGHWIQSLFIKNDAYQAPMVINPMRTEGEFEINNELHLSQSRILSNLVDESFDVKDLLENKAVESIDFEYDEDKISEFEGVGLDTILDKYQKTYSLSLDDIFKKSYKLFTGEEWGKNQTEPIHFESIQKYIFKKLLKIAYKYPNYRKYYNITKGKFEIPEIKDIDDFLHQLKRDNSHITLKLKQILNTAKYNLLKEDENCNWENKKINIPLNTLIERITDIKIPKDSDVLEYMPAAFYNPIFLIAGQADYYALSSGELQMVNVLHSILYHIRNINSVFGSENIPYTYPYINILFDEIELYFHPDLQRTFIKELLEAIKRMRIKNIDGINIMFSTHSPFILSDIPSINTLRLDEGESKGREVLDGTFGANIHKLLANDFFMKDGFMGEFARTKIEETIKFLNDVTKNKEKIDNAESSDEYEIYIEKYKELETDKEHHKNIIELIGEPVIKNKLQQMFRDAFEDEKKKQFEALAKELNAEYNYRKN